MPKKQNKCHNGADFVDISHYGSHAVSVDMRYLAQGRPGAVSAALMRRAVADKLLAAAKRLPAGYRFRIYDAWRPHSVQKNIYDEYYDTLAALPENKGLTADALHAMARTFVCYPDPTAAYSYVHSSGGAIDLTIEGPDGLPLDMGTGFDDFTELAYTHAPALAGTPAAANRKLLYDAMTAEGFTNFESEWWHYDFGDMFWAERTGAAPLYPSVYETPTLSQYEEVT